MKKLILTACAVMTAVGVYGQGTVNFSNFVPTADIDAPVFAADGSTRLAGDQFMAQLFAGASGAAEGDLSVVGDPVGFRTGNGAGYFVGGNRTINNIGGGEPAAVQVRVWDTGVASSFADAQAAGSGFGSSAVFEVTTGGGGDPPGPPANLTGMESFSLVPEPSVFALGLLGIGAVFFRRWMK